MNAGFDAEWVLDLDVLTFESLLTDVDLHDLRGRHTALVDAAIANSWGDEAKEHERELRKQIRELDGGAERIDELPANLGGR